MNQPHSLHHDKVLPVPETHPAFEWIRSTPIESLNIVMEEYRHKKTGAAYYHLASDNDENVFLVALRTVPMDDTGVAHMLEHTALCGSKHYPVRDPFFMMIRRSLNTFMNAFTSSDWTAYPFASQNRKDFNNLLDVYLDAVFFSRLHELDFAQEGWRVEFAEPENPDSDLVYKGIVFNEMKGAMSSATSVLWQETSKNLFPTTTYHYNSGGEPAHIPDLSYEELKAFYESHYHPSNAVFMTFGNIPAIEHQARFEEQALRHFDRLDRTIEVSDEQRLSAPVDVETTYALDGSEQGDRTHIVMAWLLARSIDEMDNLRANLMSSLLLDNSASPLQEALETTDLGSSPSPVCGLEDSNREMTFMAGLEGSKPENAEALEKLILGVLERVAEEGISQEKIDAALHQLELHQREIKGDHYPYGLQLILTGLSPAVHRGDPVAALNLDASLDQLREEASDPDFIRQMVRKWLLDNPHRVRLTMKPDTGLQARKEAAEKARLQAIKEGLSDAEKERVMDQARRLKERQAREDDPEILPKVTLSDVPEEIHIPEGWLDQVGATPVTTYSQGTNGLVYQQIVVDMPALEESQKNVMPYYLHTLTELGVGDRDYRDTQDWQDAVSGGISVSSMVRGTLDDVQDVRGIYVLSSKALTRNHAKMTDLLQQTLLSPRFDELPRLRELMAQYRMRAEHSVTGRGHVLAMLAASSGMSGYADMSHRLNGLEGIRRLKKLDDGLNEASALAGLAENMQSLHQSMLTGERQFLLIGDEEHLPGYKADLSAAWKNHEAAQSANKFDLPSVREQRRQCWITNTQVNFCAKAYPAAPGGHIDAPALAVLSGFLRNGFLHTSIREQGGAYGGGASYDGDIGAFRFFSYRDPRLTETLADFDQSIEWLLSKQHDPQSLVEAILGVVSSIDKPGSPAGEAKKTFYGDLFGRDAEHRREYRRRVLAVTLDDLKRVAETWLKPEQASTAIITNSGNQPLADALGLELIQL